MLHINWGKSFIYTINNVLNIEVPASKLGGKVGELPTTYQGMPLGEKSKSRGIWNRVVEKCEKRLTKWKSRYLSLGGRLTLINSLMDALPSYMMSSFLCLPMYLKVLMLLEEISYGKVAKIKRS